MALVIPYVIGFSIGLRKLGKFLLNQWPVLLFSGMLMIAIVYVSMRSYNSSSVSRITTNTQGTMLTVPQSIKYQSLPIEQTIEKECYKNGKIPTLVVHNMINFAQSLRLRHRIDADDGLGLTLIKLSTAREAMSNREMTATQLTNDTLMNITASIKYLGQMVSRFDGNLKYGILAYYKGPGTLTKEIRNGTVSYAIADRILGNNRTMIAKKVSTKVSMKRLATKPKPITQVQTPAPQAPDVAVMAITPLTPIFVVPNDDSINVDHRLDTVTLHPIKVNVDSISKAVDNIIHSKVPY